MSEDRRPSTDRWLAPLAVALLAETLLFGLPFIEKYRAAEEFYRGSWSIVEFYLGRSLFPALFGVMTLVTIRRPGATRIALIFAGVAIVLSAGGWGFSGGGRILWIFQPLSSTLMALAAPILWGSALARLENPDAAPLQKSGRIAAGVIQLAFVFQFVARLQVWGSMGSSSDPSFAIYALGEIVEGLILIWATVESLRTLPDEAAIARRAERIHKCMRAWVVVLIALSLVEYGMMFAQSRKLISLAHACWTASIYITIQLTAAFVVARRYRLQFPPAVPLTQRSGGVESTGEPA